MAFLTTKVYEWVLIDDSTITHTEQECTMLALDVLYGHLLTWRNFTIE